MVLPAAPSEILESQLSPTAVQRGPIGTLPNGRQTSPPVVTKDSKMSYEGCNIKDRTMKHETKIDRNGSFTAYEDT